MQSRNGHTANGFSESPETVPSEIVRVTRVSASATNHDGAGKRLKDHSHTIKEAISLLDLALARCRADRYKPGSLQSSVREVLESAREEIVGLETRGRNGTDPRKSQGPAGSFIRNRLPHFGKDRRDPKNVSL